MALPPLTSQETQQISLSFATSSSVNSIDSEEELMQQLQQAKDQDDLLLQGGLLEQLGDLAFSKQNFIKAVKIFNAALVINHLENSQYFYQKLEEIENTFLQSHSLSGRSHGNVEKHRQTVAKIRNQVDIDYCHKKTDTHHTLVNLTNGYKQVLCSLVEEAVQCIGPPPTGFAFMGMGSMARGEMCPFSDLEFAILIEKDTEKNLRYFQDLSRLIEIKIINLGETQFRGFAQEESITPIGLSMDSGGMTPLGHEKYQLIGTAQKLAQYQADALTEENSFLINGLSTICFLTGKESLVENYLEEVRKILDKKMGALHVFGKPFRSFRAIDFLRKHVEDYTPNPHATADLSRVLGLKKELYRPIQALLGDLRMFYALNSTNSFDCIRELCSRNLLSKEVEKNLLKALNDALGNRYEAHVYAKCKRELGYEFKSEEEMDPETERLFPLSNVHILGITETFCVITSLYKAANVFLQTQGEVNSFAKPSVID
ncbi:MAG: hypothetical protein K1000chlam2_00357 [Chlamydiae bacterium]|nr:hypothetical protein [Chlamydiota bacterium]